MITDEEFEAATKAGDAFMEANPHAVVARYDRRRRRVVVELSSGLEIAFRPHDVQGLEHATPEQLAEVEILGVGHALGWESINADVWLPGLLKGHFGTKAWMARRAAEREAA